MPCNYKNGNKNRAYDKKDVVHETMTGYEDGKKYVEHKKKTFKNGMMTSESMHDMIKKL